MAFLRRWRGGSKPTPATPPAEQWLLVPPRAQAVVPVVGEASYQPALESVARGRNARGVLVPDHRAVVTPEPQNRYDRNAVVVTIEGRTVGYLSREDAVTYGPVVRGARNAGRVIACEARLIGGWDRGRGDRGSIGVILHLGSAAECLFEMVTRDVPLRLDHGCDGWLIAFTGDSGYGIGGVPIDRHVMVWAAATVGINVHPRVTKKVQLLVVCAGADLTGNALKAREYGIPTVAEGAFWEALGLPVEPIGWRTRG